MKKVSILIADDHGVVRTGIRQVLATCDDLDVVDEAANGDELLAKLRMRAYCVVLTDLSMPGMSGTESFPSTGW